MSHDTSRDFALLYINGQRRQVRGEIALGTLLSFLRNEERLTGTKLGCGEGGCGACTVMLSHHDTTAQRIVHRAVNACLVPVAACDGMSVTTVEAVGDRNGGLAPVQKALVDSHASQCGFCTPGFVMSMYALLRDRAADPSRGPLSTSDVYSAVDGNLCRCTGYRPIIDAFKEVVKGYNEGAAETCGLGEKCCRTNGSSRTGAGTSSCSSQNGTGEVDDTLVQVSPSNGAPSISSDREFVFPPELIQYEPCELNLASGKWLRPVSLSRLLDLKSAHKNARLIVGNSELGVETKFKSLVIPSYISTSRVPELLAIKEESAGVTVGASVTWTQLSIFIADAVSAEAAKENSTDFRYNSLKAIRSQLRWFAGNQIRNVAAIGGNIVTASPISDVNPVLIAVNAQFVMLDCATSKRRSVNARDFFKSYRKVDMAPSEILLHIFIPWNESHTDFVHAFKVSRRREDDIAIVSAGIRLRLERDSSSKTLSIADASIGFGGLAPTTIAATQVELAMKGKPFEKEILDECLAVASREHHLDRNVPGGMPDFRQSLAIGFIFKAFVRSANALDLDLGTGRGSALKALGLNEEEHRLAEDVHHVQTSGIQIAADRPPQHASDITGQSVKHLSSELQVSGEATYLDDIPPHFGELQAYLVTSTEPHADILKVNYEKAEGMSGVFKIVRVDNVLGTNKIGQVSDEFCFAEETVTTVGQVIAIVTADTMENAKAAAKAVEVVYKPRNAIITIEDAIEQGSYAPNVADRVIKNGDAEKKIEEYREKGQTVEGTFRIGAQEHWYLETHGTIAVPEENGEMKILSSTQAPGKTQAVIARVLGVPMSKVVSKTKRIGGGFGGKETRNFFLSAATAVAAQATKRPVRLILDRDTDMLTTGTRHAFLAKYKAAYERDGKVVALQLRTFLNMGNSQDLSIPVLDRATYHSTNCYDIEHLSVVGKVCFTHSPSNTAFRGFGGPQGMLIAETVLDHIASASQVPSHIVRDVNMLGKHGNSSVSNVGMKLNAPPLIACWDGVLEDSAYEERRATVTEFNKTNKLRKRGLYAIPTMFGISFTFKTLNQAGALVHIYADDGSVLVSHGGVEMGQGLHTKVCQVAATELCVPLEKVFISETATDKVPNASPTAASASSDLYGMAVKLACEELNKRLQPIKEKLGPNAKWEAIIGDAWFNRIGLSASAFYTTPDLDSVDLSKVGSRGRPHYYYTNGAAVSEVEVDTITGEMSLLRTDIVMDVGRPLNPAIDVGQIEGAFVQGMGWCTMEEVVRGSAKSHAWLKPGQMHTLGPGAYKIPSASDIPRDFRVRVLNSWNEVDTIHSSKAIGEPPLFLAASVFFAIRDAIAAARRDRGLDGFFELDSPATVERIRMACADELLDYVTKGSEVRRPNLSL